MPNDQTLKIGYENHRGEYSVRRILPIRVYFGSTAYHGPQWMLEAFDLDKMALRDFALRDFGTRGNPEQEAFLAGREADARQGDIFTQVAQIYEKREAEGRDVGAGYIPASMLVGVKQSELEPVPEWACWDKEEEDFVNKRTGNSAGVPFKAAWYERRDEFPDYLEYCKTRPLEAGNGHDVT